MDEIFKKLKSVGVHNIKNDNEIILEILEDKVTNTNDVDTIIKELITNSNNRKEKKIMFECPKTLLDKLSFTKEKMKIVGERVIFTKEFTKLNTNSVPNYEIWSIYNTYSISFLSEVMGRSFNETQSFLTSMKTELPSQINDMFTVLVTNEPVGVVFPHIEPDMDKEGRIFWIGMHPKYLRKGLGQQLHLVGLYRLKNEFNAKSYLGATKVDNTPMRKIMIANGCIQNKNSVISLEYCI
ncbi:GNAT family N-acetyltransferase [Salipaludibacillus daqingensis]|uniref:GNAT family N-acetyltransferase n=1 Tax=Salipaludibacillus daqingensis TaxID=3041001 RepID=UPI002476D836|nr:GNAT family N-acetyltransferase [Salipaludibacillus daqingensis]